MDLGNTWSRPCVHPIIREYHAYPSIPRRHELEPVKRRSLVGQCEYCLRRYNCRQWVDDPTHRQSHGRIESHAELCVQFNRTHSRRYGSVQASSTGTGGWNTLATFTGGTPDNAQPYDLTPYISATTTIRFNVTGGIDVVDKTFNVDNVDITYNAPSTFASGSSPNFLSSSTGCIIPPNSSLTLTYDVIVDDPLDAGIDEITNTAYINSNEIILPLSASVTNLVVNPSSASAEVGDRVWLDGDGDGVQDAGEPGIANVEVTLKNQYGAPLMTTITDSTGHYLFTGVEPDTGYYVEVTPGTLPSGLTQSAPSGHTDNLTDPFDIIDTISLGNNRDQFGSIAFTNNDGTLNWAAAWAESDAGGSGANAGYHPGHRRTIEH